MLMYPLGLFSAFGPAGGFCNGLHWLQRDTSLMRGESCTYLWVQA